MAPIEQGDLLRIEGIKYPVIVVSNNYFNQSGMVIACPIVKTAVPGPLHIPLKDCAVEGNSQRFMDHFLCALRKMVRM